MFTSERPCRWTTTHYFLPSNSSDLTLEINPYSPAVPVVADSHPPRPIVEPIHFDGLVHRSDLMALGRNVQGSRIARAFIFFGIAGFAVFTIFMFAFKWLYLLPGPSSSLSLNLYFLALFVFPLLMIVPIWILSRFRGGYYASRILKISPRIVGPLCGTIDNETLELKYMHYHCVMPLATLTGVRIAPDAIGLTVDARKFFLSVLPKHIFHADDFERVAARLEQVAIERPLVPEPTIIEDPRLILGEPLSLLPRPEGGIAFAGTLTRDDLKQTPLYKRQIRKFYIANLFLALFSFVAPIAVFWIISEHDSWSFIVLFSTILILLLATTGQRFFAYYQYRKLDHAEITKLSGWVAKDNVTLNSTIGTFAYLRNAFLRVESDQHSIQCSLVGQISQAIFLPRHFFETDVDYESARELLHANSVLM